MQYTKNKWKKGGGYKGVAAHKDNHPLLNEE